MRCWLFVRYAASSQVQDLSNVPTKCLVPALEELLEDDGLLPLWQYLHLQKNKHKRFLITACITSPSE